MGMNIQMGGGLEMNLGIVIPNMGDEYENFRWG